MKIATYNANSIRARMPIILDWLRSETPDVLCLQETKVQDQDFPAAPIQELGYQVAFRGQKAHAGVAIISREAPAHVEYGLDDGGEPDEPRLMRAVFGKVTIVNTYVPQGKSTDSPHFAYKLEWFSRLRAFFERHYTPDQKLVWVGDFNVAPEPIDVHDPARLAQHVDFHPDARAALRDVQEWGWIDLFRQYHSEGGHYSYFDYRVPKTVERGLGWRVDHIWVTQPMADASSRCWIDMGPRRAERPSDHTVVAAEFSV